MDHITRLIEKIVLFLNVNCLELNYSHAGNFKIYSIFFSSGFMILFSLLFAVSSKRIFSLDQHKNLFIIIS